MKYRIAIRAFTLRRDIAAAYVLAKLLEKHNCDVMLCCGRNFKFVMEQWKPHAVVVNTIGKVGDVKKFAPNAKVIHWPGEGGEFFEYSDVSLVLEYGNYADIDLMLLWGEYTKRCFEEHIPDAVGDKKIKVCGNPRLDLLRYDAPSTDEKTIGILSRFNSINHYDKRPTIYTLMNPDNLVSVQLMCEQFITTCKVIDFVVEKTSYNISYRPHPLEAPEGYYLLKDKYGDRFKMDDSCNFAHWISGQKLILTPASTSFLEPYLAGVPTINIDNVINAQEKTKGINSAVGFAYEMANNPATLDELFDLITAPVEPKKNVDAIDEHIKDLHNIPSNTSALKNAADEIVKLLDNSSVRNSLHYPKSLVNLKDNYYFWKSTLFGGTNHPNFNYKSGYHKFPAYYQEVVNNIIDNKQTYLDN